jgi:D-3-phosphoglycerate dehydrogenase
VTLHVPVDARARANMIGKTALVRRMKQGSYLINNARGSVVDVRALAEALKAGTVAGRGAGRLSGGAGGAQSDPFVTPVQRLANVILTPHVGGSTSDRRRRAIAGDVSVRSCCGS